MKIFVAGGAGFIGSHTCVELLNAGYEVVVADNFSNAKPEVIDNIQKITGKPVSLYMTDLRDLEGLRKIFAAHSIDAVIHFAGLKSVPHQFPSFLAKRSESPLKKQYNESDEQSRLQRDDSHENIIHEEWHDWQALGTHFSYIFRRSTTNAKTPVRFDVIGAGPEWISVGEILL